MYFFPEKTKEISQKETEIVNDSVSLKEHVQKIITTS
jgi:hypothetical protein